MNNCFLAVEWNSFVHVKWNALTDQGKFLDGQHDIMQAEQVPALEHFSGIHDSQLQPLVDSDPHDVLERSIFCMSARMEICTPHGVESALANPMAIPRDK